MKKNYKPGSNVHILLNEYYDTNLDRYIKEHPGEVVHISIREYTETDELKEEDVIESFFKQKSKLEKFIDEKYGKATGYTFLKAKIPDNRV
jgi:hypothetical protein